MLLPDVRGLHATTRPRGRFAEAGSDGGDRLLRPHRAGRRARDLRPPAHVQQVQPAQVATTLPRRSPTSTGSPTPGLHRRLLLRRSQSWRLAASDLPLAGTIGFYGRPRSSRPSSRAIDKPHAAARRRRRCWRRRRSRRPLSPGSSKGPGWCSRPGLRGRAALFFDRSYAQWQAACTDAWSASCPSPPGTPRPPEPPVITPSGHPAAVSGWVTDGAVIVAATAAPAHRLRRSTTRGSARVRDLVRPRRPRRRQRRLRRRAARRRARPVGRPGREGQGRRHVPAPRLHPDEGAPARGRGRRRDAGCGGHSASAPRSTASTCRRARLPRGHRREEVQGAARARQGRGITVVAGEGASSRPAPSSRRRRRYTRHGRRARHRLVPAVRCPASRSAAGSSPATRRSSSTASRSASIVLGGGVIGVEFASVWQSFGAEVTIVEALDHLVAERGRRAQQGARARVPQARDRRSRSACGSPARPRPTMPSPSTLEDGKTFEADLLLVAVGRGPADRRPRVRGGRASRSIAGSSPPTSGCAPTCRTSRPSATSSPACSSRTAASSRASSWPRRSPGSTPPSIADDQHPQGHLLRARGGLASAHRGAGASSTTAPTVESYEYNLAGNGKSEILGTTGLRQGRPCQGRPRARRAHGRRPRRRAHRRGPARRELGGAPRRHRALRPRPPDPERGARRGFLALAGKPLHAHA